MLKIKKNKKSFYLTEKDIDKIKRAETFHDLVMIGYVILDRMNNPIIQICGQISTGGIKSVEENLEILAKAIDFLNKKGLNVFNQLPFERAFDKIMRNYKISGYDTPILEEFYGPIFEYGKIKTVYFLPGWRKSIGAQWEYKNAKKLGIKTISLSKNWMNKF